MSLADVTSARSSPAPEACPECDTNASVTSDLHKYQVACTCKPSTAQYACADEPGPPPAAKTDTPPALPPRPPTSVLAATNRRTNASVGCNGNDNSCRRRKYAWWCVGCGALAAALGGLLAAQHILLRAYTASPQHLETVPAAVPAAMLVLTGVCIMSLARRRNRYSYMDLMIILFRLVILVTAVCTVMWNTIYFSKRSSTIPTEYELQRKIKVVGACCLVCALTCVLVTITTTVIHMNKLQTLKFCEYTKLTRTCTCYSVSTDSPHSGSEEDGVRCVFEGVSECGVVHGALYWCLRGVFALSVSAVLVCIFSCMLAYQLLSHERKKMYWEQLELRCRSLYRPPTGQATPAAGRSVQNNCSCCAQCHTAQPAWDFSLQHRFWAPGRIGNLYSPNPGAARKTSPWSWFPWPRSNSQNSRCRMGGVPQSGDSAYGFCENETTPQNSTQPYDERSYPANFSQPFQRGQNAGNFTQNPANFAQNSGNFAQNPGNFTQNPANFVQSQSNFGQTSGFSPGFQEGFGEASGSFDAQTGVWGPPPPYSPQGRSGSRHHLHHQDPAAATLLHHHHIDVHRNSMPAHEHVNLPLQPHTCARSSYLMHTNVQMNQELSRMNPEMSRLNPEISRLNPEMNRLNPEISRLNSDISRMNPELNHLNQMYPTDANEMARLQTEMAHLGPERFNTLRGHLVPYRGCPRTLGMSAGNLHRDCRADDNVAIECLHQKSVSKVSEESSDSCPKQGKENLGFQNDKHSPIRSSMQDCRAANQNAESEVYFADVSSCCNVSVKADCCLNPNVSALVGTIENHPESTSESDTGSFTLTRQQRPQPQVGSKRRPRQNEKHMKNQEKVRQDHNSSMRLTEQQIEQLNNSMRMSDRMCDRMNDSRISDRLNDSRISERMNDSRISERMNDSRISERINDSRISDRINESRISERMNDPRISERMNDPRLSERMNDPRISERMNDPRISERINDTRISDRINEARMSERLSDSRDRLNDSRIDRDRINDRFDRINESRDRLNESRIDRMDSRDRLNDSRVDRMDARDRLNDSRIDKINESRIEDRRMSDLNASIRIEGSPKMRSAHISPLRMPRTSPKNMPKDHPRQSSSDSSKPEFFVPPPPAHSPLSPKTEESLLSDEDDRRKDVVYSNEPETSKCLGPDSQYEPVREAKEEILKTNHHHCYSDTNTMDSGWQSGSEKQVTD